MAGSKKKEEQYEVQDIVSHRDIGNGQYEYEVKWVGYKETTWEPLRCLKFCEELLGSYQLANGLPVVWQKKRRSTKIEESKGETTSKKAEKILDTKEKEKKPTKRRSSNGVAGTTAKMSRKILLEPEQRPKIRLPPRPKRSSTSDVKPGEEYEIETILNHRMNKKTSEMEYEVTWRGYSDVTWEPERNLDNCERLLTTYKKQHKLIQIEQNEHDDDWLNSPRRLRSPARLESPTRSSTRHQGEHLRMSDILLENNLLKSPKKPISRSSGSLEAIPSPSRSRRQLDRTPSPSKSPLSPKKEVRANSGSPRKVASMSPSKMAVFPAKKKTTPKRRASIALPCQLDYGENPPDDSDLKDFKILEIIGHAGNTGKVPRLSVFCEDKNGKITTRTVDGRAIVEGNEKMMLDFYLKAHASGVWIHPK